MGRRLGFGPSLLVITAAGLAIRLTYLFALAPRTLPLGDALIFHLQANVLADGHGFLNPVQLLWFGRRVPTAEHPPLFPILLSLVSRAGGRSVLSHQITTCAIGAMTVAAVGAAGRAVGGARLGLLAAGVAAVDPTLWGADPLVMSETLFALAIAVLLVVEFRFLARPSWLLAGALGVVVGLATLTRGEAVILLVVGVLPVILLAPGRSGRQRIGGFLLAAAAMGIVVAPWAVRNLGTFEHPILLSIDGDTALAGANCPATYHGALLGGWSRLCVAGVPTHGDESVQAEELRSSALHYVGSHAGRLPLVVAAREARVWSLFHPFYDGPRQNRAISWIQLGWFYALAPVAVAGAVILYRRGTRVTPFVSLVVLVVVTAALAYGIPRLRVPVDVASAILAAAALEAALEAALRRRPVPPGSARPVAASVATFVSGRA